MLMVDMLHEFKLGIWKAIFTHLMRIAHAARGITVKDLNWRYIFIINNIIITDYRAGIVMCQHSGEEQSGVFTGMPLQ
jgi:hypothetical protein